MEERHRQPPQHQPGSAGRRPRGSSLSAVTAFERLRDQALAQLAFLQDDDFDGYIAGEAGYESAMAACLDNPAGLSREQLEELTAISTRIGVTLATLKADVSAQLADASARRRASSAYLVTPPGISFDARSA